MAIVLCPGMHDPLLTHRFWNAIGHNNFEFEVKPNGTTNSKANGWSDNTQVYIVEHAQSWGFSPIHVLHYLNQTLSLHDPLILIAFSAGVVGAMGAAWAWHHQGGKVQTLIALDGWGVPLSGPFPIYRLSHDHFTHWSSCRLGMGQEPFYADPGVSHLDLWRSPHQAWGWWDRAEGRQWTNATAVICEVLQKNV